MSVHVKFWGTRGSLPRAENRARMAARLRAILNAACSEDIATPAAIDAFIAGGCRGALPTVHGGNTPCVEIRADDGPSLLIDLGTGARDCAMQAGHAATRRSWHVLLSHTHWDHIMGFPYFPPAYQAGAEINIHACHENVEKAFCRLHDAPSFPVPLDALAADIRFHTIPADRVTEINGFQVTPHELPHPGRAYGFRVERAGRSVVYASDAEHKVDEIAADYPYIGWIRGADVLIFDAQYSLAESTGAKEDWGHGSNVIGAELAARGGIGHLVLFHHDPMNDDETIERLVAEARQIAHALPEGGARLQVSGAWDGLDLEL